MLAFRPADVIFIKDPKSSDATFKRRFAHPIFTPEAYGLLAGNLLGKPPKKSNRG
jgi:hypothetical protein